MNKNQILLSKRVIRATVRLRRKLDHFLTSATDDLIKYEKEIQNQKIKKFMISATIKFRMFYRKNLKSLELDVYRFMGKSKISGEEFTLLYVGDGMSKNYFIQSFFQNNDVQTVPMERVLSSKIKNMIDPEQQKVDLVVFERNIHDKWTPPFGEWIRSPSWVSMVYEISSDDDIDTLKKKISKTNKKNFSKIQNAKLFPLISQQKEDVEYFYHRMYVPLIKARHPDDGQIVTLELCHKYMSSGIILFSCLPDGKKVAGAILLPFGKTLYGMVNGLLDGDENFYKMGALSSVYFFALEYAFENQFYRVDIGGARPLEKDGIYVHKERWNFSPEIDLWDISDWLFWIPNKSKEAFIWFKNNRFLPQFSKYHGEQMELLYSKKNMMGF